MKSIFDNDRNVSEDRKNDMISGTQKAQLLTGIVTLTNTKEYPFNDSMQTVVLEKEMACCNYLVNAESVKAAGEVGDIIVLDKAVNGFKIMFTGSAKQADIQYFVSGGLEHDSE